MFALVFSLVLSACTVLGVGYLGTGRRLPITRSLVLWWLMLTAIVCVFGTIPADFSVPLAIVPAGAYFVFFGGRVWRANEMRRYIRRLGDPRTQAEARARILALVAERAASRSLGVAATELLAVSSALLDASLPGDAVYVLLKVPVDRLPAEHRWLCFHNLALARLRTADTTGARDTLRRWSEVETSLPSQPRLLLLDALVLAHEDKCAEAVAIVDRQFAAGLPANLHGWAHVARAHACAGLGDLAESEASLGKAVELFGRPWLERVARSPGPARAVAARMLAPTGSAYR